MVHHVPSPKIGGFQTRDSTLAAPGRYAWCQVVRITMNHQLNQLQAGIDYPSVNIIDLRAPMSKHYESSLIISIMIYLWIIIISPNFRWIIDL